MTPNPDYQAIIAAARAASPLVTEATIRHHDGYSCVFVSIRTSAPIRFGDETWLAVNDAVSDASPLVDARLTLAEWGPREEP